MKSVVGVLALQGAFVAHQNIFHKLGFSTHQVRVASDLELVDSLVMPGGESTTMSHLLNSSGLLDPIAQRIEQGMPVFGTCAGMILLATGVQDARPDQQSFSAIDIDVRRNAYGRQINSFEAEIDIAGMSDSFHAVFIRAPQIVRCGSGVEVLATQADDVVLACQNSVMVASFHPELTDDLRIHQRFTEFLHKV